LFIIIIFLDKGHCTLQEVRAKTFRFWADTIFIITLFDFLSKFDILKLVYFLVKFFQLWCWFFRLLYFLRLFIVRFRWITTWVITFRGRWRWSLSSLFAGLFSITTWIRRSLFLSFSYFIYKVLNKWS
jgi:hypothetical protein